MTETQFLTALILIVMAALIGYLYAEHRFVAKMQRIAANITPPEDLKEDAERFMWVAEVHHEVLDRLLWDLGIDHRDVREASNRIVTNGLRDGWLDDATTRRRMVRGEVTFLLAEPDNKDGENTQWQTN